MLDILLQAVAAVLVGLVVVVIVDLVRRLYLLLFRRDDYKTDEAAEGTYAADKGAEAKEILSRYRLTRWLVDD